MFMVARTLGALNERRRPEETERRTDAPLFCRCRQEWWCMGVQCGFPERCLDAITDAVPIPICVTNNLGKLVSVNQAFARLFGVARASLTDKHTVDLEEFGAVFRDIDEVRLEPDVHEIPVLRSSIRPKNGESRAVSVHRALFDDNAGQGQYTVHAVIEGEPVNKEDLLGSSAEEAVRGRVRELRCLYDVSIILDLLDQQTDDVMQRIADRVPNGLSMPNRTAVEIQIDERCYRSANFSCGVHQLNADIRTRGLMRGHIRAVYMENDYASAEEAFLAEERALLRHLARAIGQALDANESLRRIEKEKEHFEHTFEQAAVGICHVSIKGHIRRINRRFCEILGYAPEEMRLMTFMDITHPDDLNVDLANVESLVRGDQNTYSMEKRFFRKDGAIIWGDITMSLVRKSNGEPDYFIKVLQDVTTKHQTNAKIRALSAQVKRTLVETIGAFSEAMEHRDPYTAGHQQQVTNLAVAIGEKLHLDESKIEGLRIGSLIHDIGKIYLPAELLSRPGRLTALEFELIKTHAEIGYDIVKGIDMPWPVAEMVRQHHERLDGSGYPDGLKNGDIIIEARIIGVADTVDAVASHRPYRTGRRLSEALDILGAGHGTAYDADVVDCCMGLLNDGEFTGPYIV